MSRKRCNRICILTLLLICSSYTCSANNNNVSLSRSKRAIDASYKYLIFPQGSNVQLIYCLTIGSFARPQGFFTLGVTAGLAYELPYRRTVLHRKPAEVYHRRTRRDLYRKLEAMLNAQGKDGRGCVLQALCRAGRRNRQTSSTTEKGPFLQEILHSVFTYVNLVDGTDDDVDGEHGDQESTRQHYQEAYNARDDDCDQLFHADSCPWLF